jgi:cytosine permease
MLSDDNDEGSANSDLWLMVYLVPILGGLAMTMTAMYGFWALETLSLLLAPVLALVTALLLVKSWKRYNTQDNEDTANSFPEVRIANSTTSKSSLGHAISSVAGLSMVGAIIAPDYTRFIRERPTGAVSSAFVSYAIVQTVVECSGGFAAVVFHQTSLLSIMKSINLQYEAFVLLIAGSWLLNAMNLYSLALSLEATFISLPDCYHVDRRYVIGTAGLLGTILAMVFNILDEFLAFLYWLSVTFAPVAGVIVVDYVLVRHRQYEESLLLAQQGQHEFRFPALVAWLLGIIYAVIGVLSISGVAAMDAFLVAATVYFFIMKFFFRCYAVLSWRSTGFVCI